VSAPKLRAGSPKVKTILLILDIRGGRRISAFNRWRYYNMHAVKSSGACTVIERIFQVAADVLPLQPVALPVEVAASARTNGCTHPDGYVKIKSRSKDIIISGRENISSIKIKDVLYKLPEILAAAIAAKLNPKWGEGSCAFVELKDGATATEDEIIALSQPARALQGPKKSCSDAFQRP
jgi:hypothetical protein